jgi:hypothetical protein
MKTKFLPLVLATSLMAVDADAQTGKHSFAIVSEDNAVITDADIVEYRFAEHALKIRGESLLRMARLRPPLSGDPFHVVVNEERIYSGRFTSQVSSMSFKEPTILAQVDTNQPTATVIICGPSHHEPQFQTGTDPRVDVRITRALAALGKLTAGLPGGASDDDAFSGRVAEILTECQKMTPGTTRAEFLKIFETEGGLQNKTFVHRHCPYIKVDVEFTPSEPQQKRAEARPTDTIHKISKPYLALSIAD